MSGNDTVQSGAVANSSNPLNSLAEPLATTVKPPAEAHERSRSLSSDETGIDDVEKEPSPPDDMAEAKRVATSGSEVVYPARKEVLAIMIALLLSVFLVALDRTIIATAIPRITDDFHSLDDIGWYGSAFLLTSCCFQLVLGRVYTFYTPKYVFLILIAIFEVGSAVCGAAPNSIGFIFGRAIAGIGAAGIMSGAIVLMVQTVPLEKRPIFQGLFGAVFGVASVAGPLLGGVFTTDVSWRWCFYINLPIGAVTIVVLMFLLKPGEPQQKNVPILKQLAQLDLIGQAFLFPCIICLLLALQWGGTTYAWSDGRVIALFVVFAVLLVGFGLVQFFRQETATIQFRIVRNRSVIAAMWFTFCFASCMMMLVYYLPIWFQAIKGNSAVESGIRTIPLVLSLVVGTITAGQIVGRIGYYTPFIYLSCIIMPIGAGLITTFTVHTGEGVWIGYQVLYGIGLGVGMQQANMAVQTVLPRRDVPMGVSLVFFTQMLGGAIFISVGENVFDSALVAELVRLVKGLDPTTIVNTGATDLRALIPASQLPEVLVAYNAALRKTFVVATAMAALAILGGALFEWKSVKHQMKPKPGADADAKPPVESAEEKV